MPENVEESPSKRRRRSRRGSSQSFGITGDPAVPTAALPRRSQIIADKYRIEELLGRGGMGAVYTATHLVTEKRVAMKWMLPVQSHASELSERFLREARATARIDHPNVVDIYDVGEHEGSVYLVMELLQGETLADRLDREPVTPVEAVALIMPALRAVAAAHDQGVIHRDLKPDNIFLCTSKDGELREVKVLDFGISKIAADDRRDLAMTASGTVMGTPYYMSPEQIRGLKEVDQRGDVYAFGVILYEMLADCYPFDADTYNALILKIATTDPVPLGKLKPELDPGLVDVVMRAMARDPEQRFQSVHELAVALEPYAGGVTFRLSNTAPAALSSPNVAFRVSKPATSTRRAAAPEFAAAAGKKKVAWIAAGAAVALGLALLALWALSGSRPGAAREVAEMPHEVKPSAAAPVPAAASAAGGQGTTEQNAGPDPDPTGAAAEEQAHTAAVLDAPETPPVAATAEQDEERDPSRSRRASSRAGRRRSADAAPGAETAKQPAAPSRPSLPSDWDERLPLEPRRPAGTTSAPAGKTAAGRISADDL